MSPESFTPIVPAQIEGNELRIPFWPYLQSTLEGIQVSLGRLDLKLDGKADRTDVQDVRGELQALKIDLVPRVGALEQEAHDRKVIADNHNTTDERLKLSKRQRWAVLGTVLSIAATLALSIGAYVHPATTIIQQVPHH